MRHSVLTGSPSRAAVSLPVRLLFLLPLLFLPPGGATAGACAGAAVSVGLRERGAPAGSAEPAVIGGEAGEIEVVAWLDTPADPTDPPGTVGGWALSVRHDPGALEILDATHDPLPGLATDPPWTLGGAFTKTEIVENETGAGFVSATVLLVGRPIFLPPDWGGFLARARYRRLPPPLDASFAGVFDEETAIRFSGGLRGSGQPVANAVTVDGSTVVPCTEDLPVRLEGTRALFTRGDANRDDRLDVSDAVTVLRSLFHGDAPIRCDDAADANDDGAVDISDAIRIFGWLFLGSPPPPEPFPDPGPDPTPDALGCEE